MASYPQSVHQDYHNYGKIEMQHPVFKKNPIAHSNQSRSTSDSTSTKKSDYIPSNRTGSNDSQPKIRTYSSKNNEKRRHRGVSPNSNFPKINEDYYQKYGKKPQIDTVLKKRNLNNGLKDYKEIIDRQERKSNSLIVDESNLHGISIKPDKHAEKDSIDMRNKGSNLQMLDKPNIRAGNSHKNREEVFKNIKVNIETKSVLNQKEQEINELKEIKHTLEEKLTYLENNKNIQTKKKHELKKFIYSLQEKLKQAEKDIEYRDTCIKDMSSQVEANRKTKDEQLNDKQNEIQDLRQKLKDIEVAKQSQVKTLTEELGKSQNDDIAHLKSLVKDRDAEIAKMSEQAIDKDAQITHLQEQIHASELKFIEEMKDSPLVKETAQQNELSKPVPDGHSPRETKSKNPTIRNHQMLPCARESGGFLTSNSVSHMSAQEHPIQNQHLEFHTQNMSNIKKSSASKPSESRGVFKRTSKEKNASEENKDFTKSPNEKNSKMSSPEKEKSESKIKVPNAIIINPPDDSSALESEKEASQTKNQKLIKIEDKIEKRNNSLLKEKRQYVEQIQKLKAENQNLREIIKELDLTVTGKKTDTGEKRQETSQITDEVIPSSHQPTDTNLKEDPKDTNLKEDPIYRENNTNPERKSRKSKDTDEEDISILKTRLIEAQTELNNKNNEVQMLNRARIDYLEDIRALNSEKDELKKRISEHLVIIIQNKSQKQKEVFGKERESYEKTIEDLKKRNQELSSQDLEQNKTKIKQLEAVNKQLKIDNYELLDNIKKSEKLENQYKAKLLELEDGKTLSSVEMQTHWELKYDKLREEYNLLVEERKTMAKEIDGLKKENISQINQAILNLISN